MRIPDSIMAVAGDLALEPELVWENDLGGLTFRFGEDRFLKWAPHGNPELNISAEVRKLRWAVAYTPVPVVLVAGSDADGSWMMTEALAGENAVTARWKADPATAVRAIGRGLRALHETLPVQTCPFTWSVESRLPPAASAPAPVQSYLAVPPPIDQLVVCHGDACAPNTLLDTDGNWIAHVDLGELGVADRWADIAIATWSTEWNYGPGWESTLLRAYGVEADPIRTAYYRRLWDPGSQS